jgi:regulator of protease activity HflC (stomatin/prohibitin superfamily)
MDLEPPRYPRTPRIPKGLAVLIVAVVGVLVLGAVSNPFVVIPSGYVGVKLTLGKASPEEMKPGLHLIIPFIQRVERMSVRTHSYDLTGANAINALSKDGLTIKVELTTLYKIMPDKASEIYVEYGPHYEDRIIKPVIRSAVRDVIATLDSAQVYQERALIQRRIAEQVRRELERRFIVLDEILIRDIRLPQKVVEAIEQKRRALEEAQRMRFLVEKEKLEAERRKIEARGIAEANRIIAGSLTREYLMWKFLENIKAYAESGNNVIILMPYDTKMTPIIQLPELDRRK